MRLMQPLERIESGRKEVERINADSGKGQEEDGKNQPQTGMFTGGRRRNRGSRRGNVNIGGRGDPGGIGNGE